MDEILDEEDEQEHADANKFGVSDISEIGSGSSIQHADSQDMLSMFGLHRLTTIRRVFEEFKVDITRN